jgi:hypothetical protein
MPISMDKGWVTWNQPFQIREKFEDTKGYTEAEEGQTMQWQNGKENMKDFALTISIKEPWWILYSKQFTDALLSYDCNEECQIRMLTLKWVVITRYPCDL